MFICSIVIKGHDTQTPLSRESGKVMREREREKKRERERERQRENGYFYGEGIKVLTVPG